MYNCVARTKQYIRRNAFVKTVDSFRPSAIFTQELPLRRLIGSSHSAGIDGCVNS